MKSLGALGVTQKTAWFMLHRIRLAMQNNSLLELCGGGGEVEADEKITAAMGCGSQALASPVTATPVSPIGR